MEKVRKIKVNPIIRLFKSLFKKIGYDLSKIEKYNLDKNLPELSSFEKKLLHDVSGLTMTGPDRIFALMKSIEFIQKNNVKGDFVECGVWRGGNLIIFQKFIDKYKLKKKIYAYDTFKGMSEPETVDKTFDEKKAKQLLNNLMKKKINKKDNILFAYSSKKDVIQNFKTKTRSNNLKCIEGKVEDTLKIKKNLPKKIAILRLDTDWYRSTKIELEKLYPIVQKNGIIIIDDYGYWKGARKAVDEFFKKKNVVIFKIDFTGRMIIKK